MGYNVEFTPTAIDDLERLSPTIQERILRKIRWLSENFDNVTLKL
jgi:mRNA interferase RelE/StbE